MSLIITQLAKNAAIMRAVKIVIAVVLAGTIATVIVSVTVSPLIGGLFLLAYALACVVMFYVMRHKRERQALAMNGQGMIVKSKILKSLIVQNAPADRILEYRCQGDVRAFFVSSLHAGESPHYHCSLATFDESDLQRTGVVHVTTQMYLIRLDNGPIMKTMRVEDFNVRTGRRPQTNNVGPRGEEVERYDVVADDEELTELLYTLQDMPQLRS